MTDALDLFLPPVDPDVDALHQSTAYYTSDPVVATLLDLVEWPRREGLLLDAGAGDGQMVLHALRRLTLGPNDVPALVARLQAWEIHPLAVAAARARVSAHLRSVGWSLSAADRGAEVVVRHGDFLLDGPTQPMAHCALVNPPYLRSVNLPPRLRAQYEAVLPSYARADILHAFMDRIARVLLPGAVLGAVTSDRWLLNESAAGLREALGASFGIQSCERLDCDSAFYRAKTRRAGTPPRVHPVAVALAPRDQARVPLTRAPFYPGTEHLAATAGVPLAQLADVRLAPWTGPEGVFVLPMAQAAHLPAAALVPCVDMRDIKQGVLGIPTRVALRTTRAEPDDALRAHIEQAKHRLPPRARQDPCWLPPESWGALPCAEEALLIPRIAKALQPIRLPAGVLPINHNIAVVSGRPARLDAIERAMRTSAAQAWIAAHAPRLEGGYLSLTVRLLRQLPLVLDEAVEDDGAVAA